MNVSLNVTFFWLNYLRSSRHLVVQKPSLFSFFFGNVSIQTYAPGFYDVILIVCAGIEATKTFLNVFLVLANNAKPLLEMFSALHVRLSDQWLSPDYL